MPYALLADEVCDHPKFAQVGLDAVGLWTLTLSWTSRHLTDGHIPTQIVQRYTAGARRKAETIAAELVAVNLWEPAEGGWQIHDFHDSNPSGAAVKEKRDRVSKARSEAGRKGMATRWGANNDDNKTHNKPITNGKQSHNPVPVPVPPLVTGDERTSPRSGQPHHEPTESGVLCDRCGCDTARPGAYTHEGIDLICDHTLTAAEYLA